MSAKKVDPKVQEWYDALSDEEKTGFNERLIAADKRLADMRMAKSTGKLDERLLIPRATPKNYDWHRKVNQKIENDEELSNDEIHAALGEDEKPLTKIKPGAKLQPNQDLSGYIKDMMGEGKVLADFYIGILNTTTKEARKRGIFMNHKLMAAAWLAERGWGKAKGEEADKGVTINLINHSDVNVPERPPIAVSAIEARVDEDNDVGRDVDVTIDETVKPTDAPKDDVDDIDVDIENFSLR